MGDSRIEEIPEGFDFETYISSYKGNSRISRSLFIAQHCNALSIEAYKKAIQDIKENTTNITKYNSALESLNFILQSRGQATIPIDNGWISSTQKASKAELESLENDLRTAKAAVDKNSIRTCHTRLGEFYYKKGELQAATKNYIRTRDYCTTSQNVLDMCFNTIKVYLDDYNFSHVIQTYISRAEGTPNIADKVNTMSKLKCCQALSLLGGLDHPNRYRNVADALMEVSFESASHFNDVMSPNDVAVYGGLCALVSFDRRQLQTRVLNSVKFKDFLALDPSLGELLESFYKSKYSDCFNLLERYKPILKLDMYLEPHLDTLLQLVREKAMIQYCIPYSIVDMRKMARAFHIDVDTLENDLVTLIGKKEKINARIDNHEKILYAKKHEKRSQAFERSISTGKDYEKSSKALLLRLNMLKADLIVK